MRIPAWVPLLAAVVSAAPLAAQGCGPAFARRMEHHLTPILRRGGFGAVIDDASTTTLIGCHRIGREQLAVIYYERIWGEASRATRRVLVVSSARGFLGMYGAGRPTRVTADGRILFPFRAEVGNVISIANGRLPRRVRLDGVILEPFR
jgi:hypothetical protein